MGGLLERSYHTHTQIRTHARHIHTHTNTQHTTHTSGELKIVQFIYLYDFSSVVLYRNAFFQRNVYLDSFRVQKRSKKASQNTFANIRIQRTVYSAQNGSGLCTVLLI
jgi:type VI protein secretion system component Hcp